MKGQVFSSDLLVSLSIFFMIIIFIVYFWFITPSTQNIELKDKANSIGDYLTSSRLGNENILLCNQIIGLANQTYANIKSDIGAERFDVFVQFNNNTPICNGVSSFGFDDQSANSIASMVRFVKVNNQKMQMVIKTYE